MSARRYSIQFWGVPRLGSPGRLAFQTYEAALKYIQDKWPEHVLADPVGKRNGHPAWNFWEWAHQQIATPVGIVGLLSQERGQWCECCLEEGLIEPATTVMSDGGKLPVCQQCKEYAESFVPVMTVPRLPGDEF